MTIRRVVVRAFAVFATLASGHDAIADVYPSKPIRFIVPFPPGGNTDVLSRLLAQQLTSALSQQVVVDNRAGAGGTIGVALAVKSPADGYTIVMGSFGSILVANSLYRALPYDPLRDLDPIILVATPPGLMVSHPSLPAETPRDLIKIAREGPNRLNYASAGNGSWNHLFGELFKQQANVKIGHVPYKGTVPALSDVMGGRIEWMFAPFPPALPQLRNGRLRALAVTTKERSAVLPDVPTVSEAGLPGYEAEGWFAVLAPRNTPPEHVKKLNQTLNKILSSPEVTRSLAEDGARPAGGTPDDLSNSMKRGIAKWREIVRALELKL